MSAARLDLVQSDRLAFERLALEHAAELSTLLRDPRVAKTLAIGGLPPRESEVIDTVRSKVAHWERHGFGYWVIRERSSGEMVGRGGLQHTFIGGLDEVEVGWAVLPARWGEGFATELAQTSVEVAEQHLQLPRDRGVHAAGQHRVAASDGEVRLHLRAGRDPRRAPARALPASPARPPVVRRP